MVPSILSKRVALAALAAMLLAGCDTMTSDDNSGGATSGGAPSPGDLPDNPPVSGRGQSWYFGYKSYDNTFRIRWPTYFATALGVGPGSYTLVEGQQADFRGYDTDNGSKRPSYTIRGPSSRFSGVVTCVLYSAGGEALGWFQANAEATTQGTLP
jgi:hypothetical protein